MIQTFDPERLDRLKAKLQEHCALIRENERVYQIREDRAKNAKKRVLIFFLFASAIGIALMLVDCVPQGVVLVIVSGIVSFLILTIHKSYLDTRGYDVIRSYWDQLPREERIFLGSPSRSHTTRVAALVEAAGQDAETQMWLLRLLVEYHNHSHGIFVPEDKARITKESGSVIDQFAQNLRTAA